MDGQRDSKGRHQSADWCKKCPVDIFKPAGESLSFRTHPVGCGLKEIVSGIHLRTDHTRKSTQRVDFLI